MDDDETVTGPFHQLIASIESVLIDPDATSDELERAEDFLEALNELDQHTEACDEDDGEAKDSEEKKDEIKGEEDRSDGRKGDRRR